MQALTYLQRALLVHDLQKLDALEWESCFNKVGLHTVLKIQIVRQEELGNLKSPYILYSACVVPPSTGFL